MSPHPSHLQLAPVIAQGRARAKQAGAGGIKAVLPLLLHTDASFAGQGLVAEMLQLSQLKPFHIGGTIHVVINNQIGFTTNPEEGRTARFPTDIGKLIENLLQLRKARAQTENVEIAFARPHAGTAMVMGDPSQLSRVIENLLANAISFSPPGGVVRIAATRIFERVIVTVDDDGPGIPENAREAVFERFHSDRRGDEAFGKHSGLGLSIARTIVNGHNGSIEAVSREPGQQGARIEFRLPALEV